MVNYVLDLKVVSDLIVTPHITLFEGDPPVNPQTLRVRIFPAWISAPAQAPRLGGTERASEPPPPPIPP